MQTDKNSIIPELLLQEGETRARTRALCDALEFEELKNRIRRCLKASRSFERSGKLFISAVLRGMARGYKKAANGPFMGLDRR